MNASDFEVIIRNDATERCQAQPLESMTRPNFRFRFMVRHVCERAVAQLYFGQTGEIVTEVVTSVDELFLHM